MRFMFSCFCVLQRNIQQLKLLSLPVKFAFIQCRNHFQCVFHLWMQRNNIQSLQNSNSNHSVSLCVSVEPEQDLLTCGDCQREFALSDIVHFIQHKVSRCNKENVQPAFDACHDEDEDGNDDDHHEPFGRNIEGDRGGGGSRSRSLLASIISSHRTSISAPINRKDPEVAASSSTVSHDEEEKPSDTTEQNDDNQNSAQGNNTTISIATDDKATGDDNNDAQKGEEDGGDSDNVKIIENGIDHDGKEAKSSNQKSGNSQPTTIGEYTFTLFIDLIFFI